MLQIVVLRMILYAHCKYRSLVGNVPTSTFSIYRTQRVIKLPLLCVTLLTAYKELAIDSDVTFRGHAWSVGWGQCGACCHVACVMYVFIFDLFCSCFFCICSRCGET